MGKAVKAVASVALVVGASIVTFNPGTGAAIAAALSTAAGVTISTGAVMVATGLAASAGLAGLQRNLMGGAAAGALQPFDPGRINTDKATFRKIAFGRTLFAMDLRYAEPSADAKQEYVEYVFALAGHRCEALEQIYIDEKLAWAAGAASGDFAGYLWVEFIPEAGPAAYHTVNAGTKWGAAQRLTGCATMKVRVRRSDLNKNSHSPFANGLYGSWRAIGLGMPVYDPALDSTVPGGAGPQRADDCATWRYAAGGVQRGNNPALQELAYLLGWKVMGQTSVGLGLDETRINLPSFAIGAAICDEAIAITGGSQRRYTAGKTFTDGDDPRAVLAALNQAMNAEHVHDGGQMALRLGVNDLIPELILTEDDFLSGYSWEALPGLEQQFTVVRGQWTEPAAPGLFTLVDAPDVATGMPSVAPRPLLVDLSAVQNIQQAERILTQCARRVPYDGRFRVQVGVRGWGMRQNMVVGVTIPSRGWAARLFRARGLTLNNDPSVTLELRPEAGSIYVTPTTPAGNIEPVDPTPMLAANVPGWLMAGIAPEATRNVGRGPWASGEAYDAGDFVASGGNAYECLADHVSGPANKPPSAEWRLLVSGGASGVAGDNVAMVTIYKRAAVAPAGPSGNLIYDFSGVLTEAAPGNANGWALIMAESDGNPLWSRQAGARNAGASDTISAGEWSASKKIVQDGAPGVTGDPGAPGAPGDPGAPGLSIAASRPVMNVGLFSNGSPKPGELPQTTQMIVYDGSTDVTSTATYSVPAQLNCTASHAGGGAVTLTAVTDLPAHFDVQAGYGGKSITMRIAVAAPKDGPAASNDQSSLGAPTSGGSYGAALGYVDLVVPAGAEVNAWGALEYRAVDNGAGSRNVTLRAIVSIENLTDAGAESYGTSSVGSQAVFIHGDGDSDIGFVSAVHGVSNGTGATKTFRARFYTMKEAGNSTARTGAGDYSGTIDISAA